MASGHGTTNANQLIHIIMKKKILLGIGGLVLLFVLWSVYGLFIATPASPPDTTEYSNQGLEISVNYLSESKKLKSDSI